MQFLCCFLLFWSAFNMKILTNKAAAWNNGKSKSSKYKTSFSTLLKEFNDNGQWPAVYQQNSAKNSKYFGDMEEFQLSNDLKKRNEHNDKSIQFCEKNGTERKTRGVVKNFMQQMFNIQIPSDAKSDNMSMKYKKQASKSYDKVLADMISKTQNAKNVVANKNKVDAKNTKIAALQKQGQSEKDYDYYLRGIAKLIGQRLIQREQRMIRH